MLFDAGCVVCEQPTGPVCRRCRARLRAPESMVVPGVDACRVGFVLDDRSRAIIAAFKYRRQRRIARWLAHELAPLVPRCADVITWVPATPERRRTRGFDQAEQLALALSTATDVPAARLLGRSRTDQRQTGRSRAGRLAGPALHARLPAPGFIVLVDDVVTTGSSVATATAVLRAEAASQSQRIIVVAAAATPAPRRSSPRLDECD